MESYEHVAKIWIEAQGFVVSSGVKFMLKLPTKKKSRKEAQEHGYEVDLIAARQDRLVLVNVKSYFGSKGLGLTGLKNEKMFSRDQVWEGIITGACHRYGYSRDKIELWVVAGLVSPRNKTAILKYLQTLATDRDTPTRFFDATDVAQGLVDSTESKTYFNDPVIATVRTLREARFLKPREGDTSKSPTSKRRTQQPHV